MGYINIDDSLYQGQPDIKYELSVSLDNLSWETLGVIQYQQEEIFTFEPVRTEGQPRGGLLLNYRCKTEFNAWQFTPTNNDRISAFHELNKRRWYVRFTQLSEPGVTGEPRQFKTPAPVTVDAVYSGKDSQVKIEFETQDEAWLYDVAGTFTLSAAAVYAYDDATAVSMITINRQGSFAGAVNFSILAAPTGLSVELSQDSVAGTTLQLLVTAPTTLEALSGLVRVRGVALGIEREIDITVEVANRRARFYQRMYAYRKGVALLADGRCFLSELQKAAYSVFSFVNSPLAPARYTNDFEGFGRLVDDFYSLGEGTGVGLRVAIMKSLVFNQTATGGVGSPLDVQFNAVWAGTENVLTLLDICQLPGMDKEAMELNFSAVYRGYVISAAKAIGEGTFTGAGFIPFGGWDGSVGGEMIYEFLPRMTSDYMQSRIADPARRFTVPGNAANFGAVAANHGGLAGELVNMFIGTIIRGAYPLNSTLKLAYAPVGEPELTGNEEYLSDPEAFTPGLLTAIRNLGGTHFLLGGAGRRSTFRDLPFGYSNRAAYDAVIDEGGFRQLTAPSGGVLNGIYGYISTASTDPDNCAAFFSEGNFQASRLPTLGAGISGSLTPRSTKGLTFDTTALPNSKVRLGDTVENGVIYRGLLLGGGGARQKMQDLVAFWLKVTGVPDINT